jgi:RNA polymerase sigma-70 factor (ECF subfamily)
MSSDELLLIQRAKKGDTLALARLHDTYFPLIYRFFYYRMDNPDLIGDLTAGTFSRMVERLQTYKVESMKFLPWLYMLAKSLMMETLLERGTPYKKTLPAITATDLEPPLSANRMKSLLCHLSIEERDVLIGKLIERRSTRDVAREIGRSVPAVKALQRQGLRHLRQLLPSGEPA